MDIQDLDSNGDDEEAERAKAKAEAEAKAAGAEAGRRVRGRSGAVPGAGGEGAIGVLLLGSISTPLLLTT